MKWTEVKQHLLAQCDCKGHPGWTSWPTKIGSTSPGVKKDALRIYRDVTRELGIKLGMHFSSLWDARGPSSCIPTGPTLTPPASATNGSSASSDLTGSS
jgi:hypothetical protein